MSCHAVLIVAFAASAVACAPENPDAPATTVVPIEATDTPPGEDPAAEATDEAPGAPEEASEGIVDDAEPPEEPAPPAPVSVLFSLNVHDHVFPDDSIAVLHKVIDLHEQAGVPIDIYLTDPMVQLYMAEAPDLMERLRTSPQVAVSYHVRPPAPYYAGFDFAGIGDLQGAELHDALLEYETHALDLETGLPSNEQGGYAYLAKLMGYAPLAVGMIAQAHTGQTLADIYLEHGATFGVVHGKDTAVGDIVKGLWARPETVEIKLYEHLGQDPKTVIDDALAAGHCGQGAPSSCPANTWIGIKMHENNWYTIHTPWWPLYFEDKKKTSPLLPPFDLDAWQGVSKKKSPAKTADMWALYEGAVTYVAEHPKLFRVVNLFDVVDELPGG